MNKPNLRLANTEEPTQTEIFMARISQGMREYRSPSGDISNVNGWHPIETKVKNALLVDDVIARSQCRIVVDSQIPLLRRLFRYLRGIR